MSEREFNDIFAERLRYYLSKYEMTQLDLSKRLGVGTTSVYNWCNGIKTPRMDKVDAMCKIFNCQRSDLINEERQQNCDLFGQCYGKDAYYTISNFLQLDAPDRQTVDIMIDSMLKNDKYRQDIRKDA